MPDLVINGQRSVCEDPPGNESCEMGGGSGDPPDTHLLCCEVLFWEECDDCTPEMEVLKNDCRGAESEYYWFTSYGSCLCDCTGCVPDFTMKFTLDGDPPNSCDEEGEPVIPCDHEC